MGGGGKGKKGRGKLPETAKGQSERNDRISKLEEEIEKGRGSNSIWPSAQPVKRTMSQLLREGPPNATETSDAMQNIRAKIAAGKVWANMEQQNANPASHYYDSSQRATEVTRWRSKRKAGGDLCWPTLRKMYGAVVGGGMPPTPGSHPSTWPTPGGAGLWKLYFPQELLVEDFGGYLTQLAKRRRLSRAKSSGFVRRAAAASDDEEAADEEESDADDDYKHDHYADEDKSEEEDVDSGGDI